MSSLGRVSASPPDSELSSMCEERTMNEAARLDRVRVFIVDRDRLVREGLLSLMAADPALEVVGEAGSGAESVPLVASQRPHVILLSLELGSESGLDFIPALIEVSPESRIIVTTHGCDVAEQQKAMLFGAMGVVQKDAGSAALFKAIQKVHAGEVWFDRLKMGAILRDLLNQNTNQPDPVAAKIASLTPREREITGLVCQGLKNRAIGERLFISETTVRHHLTSVFEKLDIANRLELMIFALSEGLATLPQSQNANGHGTGDANGNGQSIDDVIRSTLIV
jgi:DNA-binding NarL/FixJ family response regulator